MNPTRATLLLVAAVPTSTNRSARWALVALVASAAFVPLAHASPTDAAAAEVQPLATRSAGLTFPSQARGLVQSYGDATIRLGAWAQVHYERSQASEDELLQGGTPLNQDRFVLRRARLHLQGDWDQLLVELEADFNTIRQASVGVRRANVGWWLPGRGEQAVHPVRVRVGLTETSFGGEVRRQVRRGVFARRTRGSSALFPGVTDVGLRVDGGVSVFRYDLGVQNGTPVADGGTSDMRDPTAAPDWTGRLGAEATLADGLQLELGVSGLFGEGFSPGQSASTNQVVWRDLNENGSLEVAELVPVPGRAATPSQTFSRWAAGADISLTWDTRLGRTTLWGEGILASNLDRGFQIADPVATGADQRSFAWTAAIVQELTQWAFAGFRAESYNPDADLLDSRRGRRVPRDASIQTWSPLVGVRPTDGLRVTVQYDIVQDRLGRDSNGVPTDLGNDLLTIQFHGEL